MRKIAVCVLVMGYLLSACNGATVQIGIEPSGAGQLTSEPVNPAADTSNAEPSASPTPAPTETPPMEDAADAQTGAAGETTIIPAGWVKSTNDTYGVTFSHPPGWTLDPAYMDRLSGPDGFVQLGAMGGPDLAGPADACQQQANHILMPFGTDPRLEPITVDGMGGCLIVPGGDHADAMGGQQEAIIRYPQPAVLSGISYEFLMVDADPTDMAPILVSLRFVDEVGMVATPTPLPTPSPLQGNTNVAPKVTSVTFLTPTHDVLRGSSLMVEWTAQGAETLLCTRERLVNFQARNEMCQQVAMTGAFEAQTPTSDDVFALDVSVTAYGMGISDTATETIWFTCTENWFLADPPPTCPAYGVSTTDAIGQQFEHGWMIYIDGFISPQKLVFVFFDAPPGVPRDTFLVFEAPDPQAPASTSNLFPPDPHFWPILQRAEMTTWGDAEDGIGEAVGRTTAYPANLQWEQDGEVPGWYFMNGPGDLIFQFSTYDWMASGVGIGEWHRWKPSIEL